jgi:hypothetical protein
MARGEGSLSLFLFSLSLAGTHGKSKAASVLESFLGFCSLVNGQRCRGRSQQTENRPAKEAVVVSTARFFASIRVHLSDCRCRYVAVYKVPMVLFLLYSCG